MCDWYATFAALAGVDPADTRAAQASLPPIDGLNMWPLLSGTNATSPRTELYGDGQYSDGVWPAFLIQGDLKLLVGTPPFAVWTGPTNPNASFPEGKGEGYMKWNCSACNPPVVLGKINCTAGCLYNVTADCREVHELSSQLPAARRRMMAR